MGVRVPLWGGFNVHGGFALKLRTEKAKMTKDQWAAHLPALKRAASQANNNPERKRLKMWFDNEGVLKVDSEYLCIYKPNTPKAATYQKIQKYSKERLLTEVSTKSAVEYFAEVLSHFIITGPPFPIRYLKPMR